MDKELINFEISYISVISILSLVFFSLIVSSFSFLLLFFTSDSVKLLSKIHSLYQQ